MAVVVAVVRQLLMDIGTGLTVVTALPTAAVAVEASALLVKWEVIRAEAAAGQ